MKFNCGLTRIEKIDKLGKWHNWFAWHPVRICSEDCRWLEKVERKGKHIDWTGGSYIIWEYRIKEPTS